MRRAAVTLLLAASAGQAQSGPFAEIPGVTILYYDVAGTDLPTIRAAMRKLRPTDPADQQRVDALTRTALHWSWPVRDGACRLQDATVTFSATVTLPRLADAAVPETVRLDWARYLAVLEAHELTHLRNGYNGRLELLAAIKAATCDTADAVAKAALAAIQQRDIALDRATDHGARDPATGAETPAAPATAARPH